MNPKKKRTGAFALIERKGEILLVLRKNAPYANFWGPPGGEIKDEHPKKALIREVEEETGYEVIVPYRLETYSEPGIGKAGIYRAHVKQGDLKPGKDVKDAKWFPKTTLESIIDEIAPPFRKILRNYIT